MNIAIWIIIALVCFVLPATALTSGGKKHPDVKKLHEYAHHVGLPLPDVVIPAVVSRIRRRQRGMSIGGTSGIVIATIIHIVFFDNDDGVAPVLVFFLAGVGTALGGAWAIAAHRPSAQPQHPVVARLRSVELSDYLTRGERFGFWTVPAVVTLGSIAGVVLLLQLPATLGAGSTLLGSGVAIGSLLTWVVALIALRRVLAAPARSESELELAWDDAERADGLRQVVNLTVAVACISLLFWLICIGEVLISDGFYREHEAVSLLITGISVLSFGVLVAVTATGPMVAWLTGYRKGYEQRQLWPSGVPS